MDAPAVHGLETERRRNSRADAERTERAAATQGGGPSAVAASADPFALAYASYPTSILPPLLDASTGALALAELRLEPARLLSLAKLNHGWSLVSGERSLGGHARLDGLLATALGAALEFRATLHGRIGVQFMQSYERFGVANLSWGCRDSHEGYALLDGRHADPTSLSRLQTIEAGEGACTLRLTNEGAADARTHFKVEFIQV